MFRIRASVVRLIAGLSIAALALTVTGCKKPAPPTPAAQAAAAMPPGAAIVRIDAALDQVIPATATLEKVADGFAFTEGPMWRDGELWVSDLVGNKMYAIKPDGAKRVLIDKAGGLDAPPPGAFQGSNALVTDKDGSVLMNQHGLRRIVRLDGSLKMTVFLDKYEGGRLNSPNDMVFRKDGSLYITDPPYGMAGQDKDPAKQQKTNNVYRYADGKLTAIITDIPRPNGIGFSPDDKTLYVSNSEPDMYVRAYDIDAAGKVSNMRVFASFPAGANGKLPIDVPDGLKIDTAGNVWASGPGGIRVISPQGKVLGQIKLPEKAAANLAFAEDGKTVYICSSTAIYRLKGLAIAGQMPLYTR